MNNSDTEKIISRTILDPPSIATRVDLESNIVTLLHQISHHGRQMFIEGLGREKLSLSHWMILEDLSESPKTMRELTETLALPPSSVTGLVDTLVERQALERISDPDDRRVVRVRLTSSGLEYVAQVRAHLKTQYQMAMNDLDQTELTLLERMYQTMLNRMLEYRQSTTRQKEEREK